MRPFCGHFSNSKHRYSRRDRKKREKEYVDSLQIHINRYNFDTLLSLAIDDYNGEIFDLNDGFVKRICRNYLRHNNKTYKNHLKTKMSPHLHALLKAKVNAAILETYPYLHP